jgi:tetratricopeptide (TPR) repeat protein
VSRALLEASGYLRNPTSGYLGRRFQIYVDLLGAPNQVQSRSYKDDYFVVVTASPELQTDGVRHAYLHYLLDPLALKYSESLLRKKALADYAGGAPALEDGYKEDYILLATECFIKAVESRLAPSSQRQALVDQALKEGFVLTPAFAEGLAVFEKQPTAMRLYFLDLVEAIDLVKEQKRLANVQFVSARSVHMVKGSAPPEPPPLTGAEKSLAEAQELSAKRVAPPADLEKARELFLRSLQQTSNSTLHAKAYYGLARIAALQKNPESAERMFEKVLELTPDAETKCWTNVYLGLLDENKADPQERRDGLKRYQAALAVEGAPESARKAANDGLERLRKDK